MTHYRKEFPYNQNDSFQCPEFRFPLHRIQGVFRAGLFSFETDYKQKALIKIIETV